MFIAIRDIRFAKGRFALIASVIALMTFMVVALSALTRGLADQSVSAVTRLPGRTLALQSAAAGATASLGQSALDPTVVSALTANRPGAARLGVTTTRATAGDAAAALTVFGADPRLSPGAEVGAGPDPGTIMVNPDTAAALHVGVGDPVRVGSTALRIAGIGDTGDYAHTPVGYTTVDTWRELAHGQALSAVVLDSAAPAVPGVAALPMNEAASAVPGYGSEHGSLLAMQALLLAISALVVGAFFAVWTVQRRRQLAVVRALGGSRGYLLRDSIGQALLILAVGEAVGATLGAVLATAVSGAVPITLTLTGVAAPAAAMAILGALGALAAVRTVTAVDPLVALSA